MVGYWAGSLRKSPSGSLKEVKGLPSKESSSVVSKSKQIKDDDDSDDDQLNETVASLAADPADDCKLVRASSGYLIFPLHLIS